MSMNTMRAAVLEKYGPVEKAFKIREWPKPKIDPDEVLIKVEAFGLNFADTMAVKGLYKDAPDAPGIIGYEVVGIVEEIGEKVENVKPGARVVALTRFGGYAEYAKTHYTAVAEIGDMESGVAAAIATQYCTAWYAACELTNIHEGDHVLVQAAAGGVGTALVQIAKYKGCTVYGTSSRPEKIKYLKSLGVDYPINYATQDFVEEIEKVRGKNGIDIVFDSVGGKVYKRSKKLLAPGGTMVGYGASSRGNGNIFSDLKLLFGFGFYHPVFLIPNSHSLMGVNMLRVADHKKPVIQRCMHNVLKLIQEGHLKPHVGGIFKVGELADAHQFLSGRASMGKIIVEWN
ncbi:MAG: zinc-binding dehydrogenase [Flavobacteriales bacterium]|nr:zinc-binding dehydrogenase [Flavobacteriales bacterium]